jgi:3-hydroxyisobutyrate dehydrogenase-like beta-hydroxyacid dehydrogenase
MEPGTTETGRTAGVIGLGRIGAGVARCTAAGGFATFVYDVDPARLDALGGVASGVGSNAELGTAADVVFVAVFDDAQLKEALAGAQGVFAATSRPRVVVVLSTVSLDTIRWTAEEAARHGIAVLDCGVAGGKGLESGSIVSMVGGDAEAYAFARPLLESFSRPLMHMGPIGSGMQAKLARNMMHYCLALVAREGGRLAAAGGLDAAKFVELVRARDEIGPGFFDFLRIAASGPAAEGEVLPEEAFAAYATKDIQAALELGGEMGVALPVAEFAHALFATTLADAR